MERLGQGVGRAADELEAVVGAEVVVTAAPIVADPDPPLGADALGERWLLLPIDFDALVGVGSWRRRAFSRSTTWGSSSTTASRATSRGWPVPHGSVGESLGRARGTLPERIACVNLGIGALDAAFAARVVAAARERGAGTELPR